MNIKQARSLFTSVRKITRRYCGHCGEKRTFAIVSTRDSGRDNHWVRVSCRCSTMEFKDFDR